MCICLATSFEIAREAGMEMIAEIKIVIKIVARFVVESCVICEIAKAAPVLDFWTRKSVMNEMDMTRVLIEPRKIRNCSRFNFPVISEPIIAA